jgi:hypothetical protein
MHITHLLAAAVLAVAIPAGASAQTVETVGRFEAVELHGGGTIRIHQGPVQRVTLVRGDPAEASFEVRDGRRLVISPCRGFCMVSHHLEVEIETPQLSGASIMGGGHITADGNFPVQGAVKAVIHGGGGIDLGAVPAQSASAQINGGGKIVVAAQSSLSATIRGGGEIRYLGKPQVNTSIHGGGSVSSVR